MPIKTLVKIIFLVIISVLALVSVICGKVVAKKNSSKTDVLTVRKIIRVRLGCFIVMLVLLFICVII